MRMTAEGLPLLRYSILLMLDVILAVASVYFFASFLKDGGMD